MVWLNIYPYLVRNVLRYGDHILSFLHKFSQILKCNWYALIHLPMLFFYATFYTHNSWTDLGIYWSYGLFWGWTWHWGARGDNWNMSLPCLSSHCISKGFVKGRINTILKREFYKMEWTNYCRTWPFTWNEIIILLLIKVSQIVTLHNPTLVFKSFCFF